MRLPVSKRVNSSRAPDDGGFGSADRSIEIQATDDKGYRRFDKADDSVMIEFAAALGRDIRVIPVLVDRARKPTAHERPSAIQPLAPRNVVEVRNTQFGRDAEVLIGKVHDALRGEVRYPTLADALWRTALGDKRTFAAPIR
jgi:hypothetical protein